MPPRTLAVPISRSLPTPGLPRSNRRAGIFEQPGYVAASAEHEGSDPWVLEQDGAGLPLLRREDGTFHTVYGYPAPFGDSAATAGLADALVRLPAPAQLNLSPIGRGADLADALEQHGAVRVDERPICVCDLDDDPLEGFGRGAQKMVDRARRGGASVSVGRLEPWFGGFYRDAMRVLGANGLYRFSDGYLEGLAALGHVQATVSDAAGVAAAALFLVAGGDASYHLSARRADPAPVPGAANLALLEGLREVRRRGAASCVLGGGRTGAEDDPLFQFKRGMATRVAVRATLLVGGGLR